MDWDYPNFTKEEMACKCGCGFLPSEELMKRLQAMRSEAHFPFHITSGARCAKHNTEVSNTGVRGPHITGLAVDIGIHGENALFLVELALKYGMTGIGISQKGAVSKRFIHLDCIPLINKNYPRPWIWSY